MAVTGGGHSLKDVYNFFVPTHSIFINNVFFLINNWLFPFPPDVPLSLQQQYLLLQALQQKGGSIWLNAKGDICYRLSLYAEIHMATPEKASRVISNFLNQKVQIIQNSKSIKTTKKTSKDPITQILKNIEHDNTVFLIIQDLLLVEGESFNPFSRLEFFQDRNGLTYRNTFKPSFFLTQITPPNQQFFYSIILQYLYYLSNYNRERFEWMLHWLADFFQNFALKSPIPLVLIGGQKSGVDILFEEIIKPLFGYENCIKITDDHLQAGILSSSLQNKLFYNFDNISKHVSDDAKSNRLLSNMIVKQKLLIGDNKNTISETDIFGQFLITIDAPYIPYLDNSYSNYTVFKVPDSIEKNMFFPEWSGAIRTAPFIMTAFINEIRNDLTNFSNILKNCKIEMVLNKFHNDDKSLILMNSDDKLKVFCHAIVTMDTTYFSKVKDNDPILYEEMMQDFQAKKIKQPNIFKCFECIYSDEKRLSSKTLMHKLRQIDTTFFRTASIRIGAGGIKYFYYD